MILTSSDARRCQPIRLPHRDFLALQVVATQHVVVAVVHHCLKPPRCVGRKARPVAELEMVVDVEFQVAKGLDGDRASKYVGCMRGALVQSDVIHRLRVECRRGLGFK